MAEYSTPEQRTEMPTDRRMGELRKEGAVHFSQDLAQVITLITGFVMLLFLCGGMVEDIKLIMVKCYQLTKRTEPLSAWDLQNGFYGILYILGPDILIFSVVMALVAAYSVLLQTKFCVKEKKIQFKWDWAKPWTGISRIFSINGLVSTGKAILKLALILPVGYFALEGFAPQMIMLMHTSIQDILFFTAAAMQSVFWKIMYLLIAIAIFDYFWGRHQWLKINKMTKDEVKDERKSIEGDEETRRRIMWKGIQRVVNRIKMSVRKADVVITNPTHYAIALKYDRATMSAPVVVAKGRGYMALRIKELAREAGVPIVERKWLARALYASVEIGAEIPYELFRAVAEVLAYVFRMKNRFATAMSGAAERAGA